MLKYVHRYLNLVVHLKIVIENQEHVFNFFKVHFIISYGKGIGKGDERLVHAWIKIWMKSLFKEYLPITFSQVFLDQNDK